VTRLSQVQISDYLKRNDVIFVAVGATESQGTSPSDMEYIAPLGSAAQMAEETDAVYMPNLSYSYPGSTITSSATMHVVANRILSPSGDQFRCASFPLECVSRFTSFPSGRTV
jgi:hypothetical protein